MADGGCDGAVAAAAPPAGAAPLAGTAAAPAAVPAGGPVVARRMSLTRPPSARRSASFPLATSSVGGRQTARGAGEGAQRPGASDKKATSQTQKQKSGKCGQATSEVSPALFSVGIASQTPDRGRQRRGGAGKGAGAAHKGGRGQGRPDHHPTTRGPPRVGGRGQAARTKGAAANGHVNHECCVRGRGSGGERAATAGAPWKKQTPGTGQGARGAAWAVSSGHGKKKTPRRGRAGCCGCCGNIQPNAQMGWGRSRPRNCRRGRTFHGGARHKQLRPLP